MREDIMNELKDKIDEGKACIVFDFGCYFPYSNKEVLSFDFQLGNEKFDNIKLNKRYPNKDYVTISRKTGRRISKIGYPYFMEMSEFDNGSVNIILCINLGINQSQFTMIFPLVLLLTKENPVCALEFRINFDNMRFTLSSNMPADDGGWYKYRWTNSDSDVERFDEEYTALLATPDKTGERTLIYKDVIVPFACQLGRLAII